MALDVERYYDRYWKVRGCARTEARSRERATLALQLLGVPPGVPPEIPLSGGARGEASGEATGGGGPRRLLDLGCGLGWTLEVFRDAGFQVAGVDASQVAVDEAARRGFAVQRLDLEAGELSSVVDGPPDVVVALEVLEHLGDPLGFLRKLRGVLEPASRVVVSLPNEIHNLARLKILCGRLPFGGHDDPHLRHFDRRQARELFRAAGYRLLAEKPVSMIPPRRRVLRRLAAPALWLSPGSFSIATVYLLDGSGVVPSPSGEG